MSVRYGFTVEIYGFRNSLRTCLARAAHDAIVRWRSKPRTQRIEDDARTSPDVKKTVNCSTKE